MLLSVLLLSTNLAYATLSAQTAKTIQGSKPFMKVRGEVVTDLNELLSFTMPDGTKVTPQSTGTLNVLATDKFNDVIALVIANGSVNNLLAVPGVSYYDTDGDTAHGTVPLAGTLAATWSYVELDGTIKTLSSATQLASTFDACDAPYTLTIAASSVKAQSAYGDPIDGSYGSASKSYTVNVADYKFCYARPKQMEIRPNQTWRGIDNTGNSKWNDTVNTLYHPQNGGGYSEDFDPRKGFKASSTTKFPTTGFVGAEFDFLMSNKQSDYTYNSSQSSAVSIDTVGHVKFLSKPAGAVIITATPTDPNYPAVAYVFNPTTVWAVPKAGEANLATSQIKCGGAANVLTRAQLTNSPRNTAPMGWNYVYNTYTRAIGGGVFGEWGWSEGGGSGTYPNSQWANGVYWTREVRTTGSEQFVIHAYVGLVRFLNPGNNIYVACEG